MPTYDLIFTEDPQEFLDLASDNLAADPVLTTVVSTVTHRALADDQAGRPKPAYPRWWVTVLDGDKVVGVAMRTAPFAPYPMFVLPMADDAAIAIAEALVQRGDVVTGVNGALPAAQVLAEELARRTGGEVTVQEHTRLWVLADLVEPPSPPGRLRAAAEDDLDLVLAWFHAFEAAAAEQVGRDARPEMSEHFERSDIAARIQDQRVWLWEDEAGQVVHLTSFNAPSFGVARVGPVYTPQQHRGRGYASSAVAAVSRLLLDQGAQVCLFTDQANPTSNKVYAAVGYVPVVEMANLVIQPSVTTPARA